jgi:hypothetical protein
MFSKALLLLIFLSPFLKAEESILSPTSNGNILSEFWTVLTSDTEIPLIQNSADVSNTDYAVSLWFKTTNGNCGLFSVTNDNGSAHDRHLYLKGGNLHARVWRNESISTSDLNLADDQWHQVTHTYGGVAGAQKLYIDGKLQAQGNKTYSHFNLHTKTQIGYSRDASTPVFSGKLTGYRMYSHALTQEDVSQNISQEYLTLYPVAWHRDILKETLNQAKTLYEQSSGNTGIEEGQYSPALRYNYNFIIKVTEKFLEENDLITPYDLNSLKQATKNFEGGVKATEKVNGKAFGRQPYWNSSWSAEKTFDGNIHSGYHFRSRDHGYVGLDLGEDNTKAVKKARFICRKGLGRRMTNNKLQGSLDGTNYVDLFTIEEEPKFEWTSVPITDETSYRFYRYYDVPGGDGYGNISELEFYTLPPQQFYMENHRAISLRANLASQVLPASHLSADHGGLLPQFITYRLIELPSHGTLNLKEVQLNVDDIFTQDELNKGYLNFSADDSRMSDSFKVEVTSAIGGLLPEVLVDIIIDSDLDGLTDLQEIALGTDFDNVDTNGNGIDDLWEVENGLDPIADTLTPLVTAIQGENGLSAAYHFGRFRSTTDFSGKLPSKVTKISQVNFAFRSGRTQVANSGRAHYVGAQYTGYLYVALAGSYTFNLIADDGARLFINGTQLINNDGLHATRSRLGTINLTAGFHPIRCDYFELGGGHTCLLKWSGPSRPEEIIPASAFFLSLPEHKTLEEQQRLREALESTGLPSTSYWSLDDPIGSIVAIDSLSIHHANAVGSKLLFEQEGPLSTKAISFDGSSHLEAPYHESLIPPNSFSVSAWIKPRRTGRTVQSFICSRAPGANGFILRLQSNQLRFYLNGGGWQVLSAPAVSFNNWHHILATFESTSVTNGIHRGTARLYVDGQLSQTKIVNYKPALSSFKIGGSVDSRYNYIGLIDEVKLSDQVIQPEELAEYLTNSLIIQLGRAKELYRESAAKIGLEKGQYSPELRFNFQTAITKAEKGIEDTGITFQAIHALKLAIKDFKGGLKSEKLTGQIFGATPAWGVQHIPEKAFDGNINSYYWFASPDKGHVGIDLGKGNEAALDYLRFFPRAGRIMKGNVFQGSLDGINYVDILPITEEPTIEWNSVEITDKTAYRYYRYNGIKGVRSWGSISEIELYSFVRQDLHVKNKKIIAIDTNTPNQILTPAELTAKEGPLLPQFIFYRVLNLPTHSQLKLNGIALKEDAVFTQQDIENQLLTISYEENTFDDSFKVEVTTGTGRTLPEVTVSIIIDSDGDGLSNEQEIALGSDPENSDSNNNGVSDFFEVEHGLDPNLDLLSPLVTAIQGENGLSASYYYATFNKATDFSEKLPAEVKKASQINIRWGYYSRHYGLTYSGYLYAPVAGQYKFYLTANDAAVLYIDNLKVIDNNGHRAYPEQESGIVTLTAGLHPIRCHYVNFSGSSSACTLQWHGPGRTQETIAAKFFFLSIPEHQALEESIDRDLDGLTDILEAQEGTDPLNPDSDGDKLLDGEEFYATYGYKTNPLSVDTDLDTVNDWDEIFIFKSNPLIADFDGTTLNQIDILPKDTSNRLGRWVENGNKIYSQTRRGFLEYEVDITLSGVYKLSSLISQKILNATKNIMDLHLYVDGEYITRQKTDVSNGPEIVDFLIGNLALGKHTIKLFWDNVYLNTSLQIESLQLSRPGGPDTNSNGRADWVDNYLANTNSLAPFESTSKVNPAQIEGKGRYLSRMNFSLESPIQRATMNHWYAEVPLSRTENTSFELSFEGGLVNKQGTILWEHTNVLEGGELTIRQGSKLLLNAFPESDQIGTATITIDGVANILTTGQTLEHLFDESGTYEITGNYQGTENLQGTLVVKVIAVEKPDTPFIWRGKQREWSWPNLPEEVVIQTAGMAIKQTDGTYFIQRDEVLEDVKIIARLGENGPIIKTLSTKAFWARDVVEGFVAIIENPGDDTHITKDNLFGFQIPEGMNIEVSTITGVVFIDGSRKKIISKKDFNEFDIWILELIKTADKRGASCHWYNVYQNGILVGQQDR